MLGQLRDSSQGTAPIQCLPPAKAFRGCQEREIRRGPATQSPKAQHRRANFACILIMKPHRSPTLGVMQVKVQQQEATIPDMERLPVLVFQVEDAASTLEGSVTDLQPQVRCQIHACLFTEGLQQ